MAVGWDYSSGAIASRVAQETAASRSKSEEVGRCQPMGSIIGVRGSALLINAAPGVALALADVPSKDDNRTTILWCSM